MDDVACAWTNQADTARTWFEIKYLSAVDSTCSLLRAGQRLWVLTPVDDPQTQVAAWFKMLLKLSWNKGWVVQIALRRGPSAACSTGLSWCWTCTDRDRRSRRRVTSDRIEGTCEERNGKEDTMEQLHRNQSVSTQVFYLLLLYSACGRWPYTVLHMQEGFFLGTHADIHTWMNEWMNEWINEWASGSSDAVSLSMGTLLRKMEGASLPGTKGKKN